MTKKSAPEDIVEPPIPFRPTSNGEHAPRPTTAQQLHAERFFFELADVRARRLGMDRRRFLQSTCATATALLVIDQISGCAAGGGVSKSRGTDGGYAIDDAMTYEDAAACERLAGDELIIDVQVHHVDTHDVETFVREVFVNSDTDVACLSGVPSNELDSVERLLTRDIVERLADSPRLLVHASVFPERGEAELDGMQRFAEERSVGAWKVYPHTSAQWRFDDENVGVPFIERARETGKPMIASHFGLAGDAALDTDPSSPRHMLAAASAFPDVTFLTYHSGFEPSLVEGPYNPSTPRGIDRLIKGMADYGLARTGNVYAELGSVWVHIMKDVTQAAHVLGKLLLHVGEDRILWGTDCIWHGSPRAQIEAFRSFQIPITMRDQYGYPELTPAIKQKIFGLNGARIYGIDPAAIRCHIDADEVATLRAENRAQQIRSPQRIYGPRTRREFLAFMKRQNGAMA